MLARECVHPRSPLLPEQPDARTRLARAAVEAFAARGFHGTTTRDISTAAGMSPAALYVHHRSKEELLFELSRVGHERVLAMVRARWRAPTTRSSSSATWSRTSSATTPSCTPARG